jgi:hypothetical protein
MASTRPRWSYQGKDQSDTLSCVLLAENFLHANPWVPAVVVTVVLFLLTWLFNSILRQRDRETKTFDYRVLSDISIFTEADRPEDLKVTYKGIIDVSDPRVTRIRFKNTGKKEIRSQDFEEAYRIERGNASFLDYKILESSTAATELATINEVGAGTPEYIKFLPKTLNRGDWFTIQIFFDGGADQELSVIGRLTGETRPSGGYATRYELSRANRYRFLGIFQGFSMLATVLIFYAFGIEYLLPSANSDQHVFTTTLLFTIAAMGVAFTILGEILRYRARRSIFAKLRIGTKTTEED